MRLVNTKRLKSDVVLANTIYNETGLVLVRKGMQLSKEMINRLVVQGITYIYIEDELLSDVAIDSVISNELRIEATQVIKDTFSELNSPDFTKKSYILNKQEEKLTNIIEQLMEEVTREKNAISLLTDILITDDYTYQHSLNVAIYTLAMASKLSFSNKELLEIGMGAILHDVGKVFIDQDVLQKTGKLTSEEYEIIKNHAQLGFDFIRKQTDLSTVIAHCAYQHHERIDGSGYPRGLTGREMHKYAKIISIADVFDAVTSNRAYRDAMLPHEGLEILYVGAVDKFDKDLVEIFKDSVVAYPNGLSVELKDGRVGVVVRQNKHIYDRPIIRIIKENHKLLTIPYEVNLAKELTLMISVCHVD